MNSIPMIKVMLSDNRAVMPSKASIRDVGYDLTIVDFSKKLKPSGNTIYYNIHVRVIPPQGYYTTVVPRSSFSKTGYVLANSEGIIDPDYRGDISVALIKVDKSKPDIKLPYKGFQLILKKFEHALIKEEPDAFLKKQKEEMAVLAQQIQKK